MQASLASAALVALTGCVGTAPPPAGDGAGASPDVVAEELEAASDAHAPSVEHASLARLVGDWTVVVEDGAGQRLGEGSARMGARHGGRFLEIDLDLVLAGRPVRATGLVGYDREAREHQALWISDLGTGMSLVRGEGSLEGAGLALRGARGALEGTSRMRLVGSDELVVEALAADAAGRELLLRRTVYRRVPR